MKDRFLAFLNGEYEGMADFLHTEKRPDDDRETIKERDRELLLELEEDPRTARLIRAERKGFWRIYYFTAIVSCVVLIGVLLYVTAHLIPSGMENVRADEVAERYIEQGLEETGAVNIVAGMILDYRAFDTLGESHVLFTALICVTVLLQLDKKNMRSRYEDYYTTRMDVYFETSRDPILQSVALLIVPCILLFGVYILLNGHLSPGGGFSGGTILGSGLIIFSSAKGFEMVDKVLTRRRLNILTFCALAFYSLAKCYAFFMGANGYENHIPKGIPGAILSSGLILPLNIAVGLVVATTMYGFYSLFRRGNIGHV